MDQSKYDARWQTAVEEFLSAIMDDPWVDGRIAVPARGAMRKIVELKKDAAHDD
jgi:hypothetical protein